LGRSEGIVMAEPSPLLPRPTGRPDASRDASTRLPTSVLWVLFIALSTGTQLAFKWAGNKLAGVELGWRWAVAAMTTPAVGIAAAGYIALFVLWLLILQRTDLTKAFALTGLIYITVPFFGWLLFAEQFGPERIIGIVCIIAGVALMGREHK
jgi:drug/metabolite transporter (DMT)-like permease